MVEENLDKTTVNLVVLQGKSIVSFGMILSGKAIKSAFSGSLLCPNHRPEPEQSV